MKQLILDENKNKKRKRKNTSTTKYVYGPWFGFFPDWKKSMDIFNQNTEFNTEPVEGEPADDSGISVSDVISDGEISGGDGASSVEAGGAISGGEAGGMSGGEAGGMSGGASGGAGAGGI